MDSLKLKKTLESTVYISLIIQAITALFNIGIIGLDTFENSFDDDVNILIQLIWLGLIVQLIEGIFYIWLAVNINSISNITGYRYYDWFFSTPTMLITFAVYLLYLKEKDDENKEKDKQLQSNSQKKVRFIESKKNRDLWDYMKDNKVTLSIVGVLNAIMLLFGYLGEIDIISNLTAVLIGFIPFITYFYIIYEEYAKFTDTGTLLFWAFTGIWSLYGISAIMPYYYKNISYNILDIFSKNFFEVFIGIKLLLSYNFV